MFIKRDDEKLYFALNNFINLVKCKMGPSNLLSYDLKLQMSDCSVSSAVKSAALPPSFELASTKSPIKGKV